MNMKSQQRKAAVRLGIWFVLSCLGPIIQSVWPDQRSWASVADSAFCLLSPFLIAPSIGQKVRNRPAETVAAAKVLPHSTERLRDRIARFAQRSICLIWFAIWSYYYFFLGRIKQNRLDPFVAAFICLLGLGVCIRMWLLVKNASEETLLPFSTLEQTWPPLEQEKGRVVVFYPRDAVEELMTGAASADITLDDKKDTLLDGTFIWADYLPGSHKISRTSTFSRKTHLEFNVPPGQVTFIEVSPGSRYLEQVERSAGLAALAKLHHAYTDARMWEALQKT